MFDTSSILSELRDYHNVLSELHKNLNTGCDTLSIFSGAGIMARRCDICGKGPQVGANVSHAHNVTKRKFYPNLHKVRARVDGKVKRLLVCSSCLKAGKVEKV